MNQQWKNDPLWQEVERDMQRLRWARIEAEAIVRDRGWGEEDEDFEFQIEQEAKEQWEQDYEREHRMRELFDGEDE